MKFAWAYELMDKGSNEWVCAKKSFIWSSLIPAHPMYLSPIAQPCLPANGPLAPPSLVTGWLRSTPSRWVPQPTASFLLSPNPSLSTHNFWKFILKPCWTHSQGLISASDSLLNKTKVLKAGYKNLFPIYISIVKKKNQTTLYFIEV